MVEESVAIDDFEQMRRHHRNSIAFCRGLLILFILIAAITVALTFVVEPVWQLVLVPLAAIAGCMTIIPWDAIRERYERIEGISVLEDEWRDLVRSDDTRPGARDEMIELLWSIYNNNQHG